MKLTTATTVLEVMDVDWVIEVKTYQLYEGVSLRILDGKEAVLSINGDEINFAWNYRTEHAFHSIETITASELLRIIARAAL